jgi:hemoglobin
MTDERPDDSLYQLIGEEGFTRLVAAFYRQVPDDDILSKMYLDHDLSGAEGRLRDFLIFRFGGSDKYFVERGHPRLRIRHAPFAITPAARDRWMQLMNKALIEAELPESVVTYLREFFMTSSEFLINRPS